MCIRDSYTADRMGPVELASCSFGQSSKVSYLQMLTAVCAVVNGGKLMQPYLVSKITAPDEMCIRDRINVKLFDHPRVEGSSEGEVVEVTVPNNRFAGTVCLSEDGRMAVEPDGCRDVKFLLAKQGSEGVHLGDKVGFLITHRGNRHSDHRAAVVEKFGSSDYASECAKAILYGRNVRQEFPPEVLELSLIHI